MKKQIIFLSIIATAFIACKKGPFDCRNKYLGNYNFTNIYSNVDSVGVISTNTTTYFGRAINDGDENVIVEFETGKSQSLRIDKDGNLYNLCGTYIGRFESESRIHVGLDKNTCASVCISENSSVAIVGERKY